MTDVPRRLDIQGLRAVAVGPGGRRARVRQAGRRLRRRRRLLRHLRLPHHRPAAARGRARGRISLRRLLPTPRPADPAGGGCSCWPSPSPRRTSCCSRTASSARPRTRAGRPVFLANWRFAAADADYFDVGTAALAAPALLVAGAWRSSSTSSGRCSCSACWSPSSAAAVGAPTCAPRSPDSRAPWSWGRSRGHGCSRSRSRPSPTTPRSPVPGRSRPGPCSRLWPRGSPHCRRSCATSSAPSAWPASSPAACC